MTTRFTLSACPNETHPKVTIFAPHNFASYFSSIEIDDQIEMIWYVLRTVTSDKCPET